MQIKLNDLLNGCEKEIYDEQSLNQQEKEKFKEEILKIIRDLKIEGNKVTVINLSKLIKILELRKLKYLTYKIFRDKLIGDDIIKFNELIEIYEGVLNGTNLQSRAFNSLKIKIAQQSLIENTSKYSLLNNLLVNIFKGSNERAIYLVNELYDGGDILSEKIKEVLLSNGNEIDYNISSKFDGVISYVKNRLYGLLPGFVISEGKSIN